MGKPQWTVFYYKENEIMECGVKWMELTETTQIKKLLTQSVYVSTHLHQIGLQEA